MATEGMSSAGGEKPKFARPALASLDRARVPRARGITADLSELLPRAGPTRAGLPPLGANTTTSLVIFRFRGIRSITVPSFHYQFHHLFPVA